MNRDELMDGISHRLKSLRACDTQATAVAWMAGAYQLMEAALEHLKEQAAPQPPVRLVFVPERPKLEVVQSVPLSVVRWRIGMQPLDRAPTVVYPKSFLHPGLKPAPKAWTHADTLRLENAAKAKAAPIQKRGQ